MFVFEKKYSVRDARWNKKDEFYTQLIDVEKEMEHYLCHFVGSRVYCNCDDPKESMFWTYFHSNFSRLGLNHLVATHYQPNGVSYRMDYMGGNDLDISVGVSSVISGDGDFRSEACVSILDECDIVVTNPPFSMFREYIDILMQHQKKFLILGNMNALNYKNIFPLIRDNRLWYGATIHSGSREFRVPKEYPMDASGVRVDECGNQYIRVKGVRWFTNMDYTMRYQPLVLSCHYTPDKYPKYDNYDAINVDKYKEIPMDYDGVMGVPITIVDFFCPEQFEIIGMTASWDESPSMQMIKTSKQKRHGPILNGREMYRRILIRKKLL